MQTRVLVDLGPRTPAPSGLTAGPLLSSYASSRARFRDAWAAVRIGSVRLGTWDSSLKCNDEKGITGSRPSIVLLSSIRGS